MKPGDQLTRAERVRLEALNQAINSAMTLRVASLPELLTRAEEIETWLRRAREDA